MSTFIEFIVPELDVVEVFALNRFVEVVLLLHVIEPVEVRVTNLSNVHIVLQQHRSAQRTVVHRALK